MRQQLDPKTIIAKANAEAKIKKQIADAEKNLGEIIRKHRNRATLLMKDGSIKTGVIKLATFQVCIFDEDGRNSTKVGCSRIEVSDIADIQI